jgi:hypothetical protein
MIKYYVEELRIQRVGLQIVCHMPMAQSYRYSYPVCMYGFNYKPILFSLCSVRKPEEIRPLGRHKCSLEDNI